jgi:hypothetical protein
VAKVVAERSYGQDEPVVISYGLKSSAECLEDHGLVPDIDMDEGEEKERAERRDGEMRRSEWVKVKKRKEKRSGREVR